MKIYVRGIAFNAGLGLFLAWALMPFGLVAMVIMSIVKALINAFAISIEQRMFKGADMKIGHVPKTNEAIVAVNRQEFWAFMLVFWGYWLVYKALGL